MIIVNHQPGPYFHDVPAADIQKWFSNSDPSYSIALEAYQGRGVYEGQMVSDQSSYDQVEHFSFDLEKDSLREYLDRVEDLRHTTLLEEGEKVLAKITNLVAVVNYLDNNSEASPVLSDVPHLDELLAVMFQHEIRPEWFAWIPVKDGKILNLVPAEKQDQQASEDVLKVAQSLYDSLNQSFEPLFQKAGFQKLDGILLSGAEPGYDFNHINYHGSGRTVYDDLHNTAIIQCQLTR